jgi:hypothetical protein
VNLAGRLWRNTANMKIDTAGLEITADQRSMIGRKLFLIGEEATLPFILIGKKYI